MTKLALFCNIGSLMWAPEGTLLQLAPKLLSTDPHGARRRFRQAFVWLANLPDAVEPSSNLRRRRGSEGYLLK